MQTDIRTRYVLVAWLACGLGACSSVKEPAGVEHPGSSSAAITCLPSDAGAAPAWAPNISYAAGALVTFNGSTYQCVQAHKSQVGWEPPKTPALWQSPPPCNSTGGGKLSCLPINAPAAPAWAAQTIYPLNALVTYGGQTYQCVQGHTSLVGWQPPNTPALWQSPPSCGAAAWAPQTSYGVGNVVFYGLDVYRAISSHLSTVDLTPVAARNLWNLVPPYRQSAVTDPQKTCLAASLAAFSADLGSDYFSVISNMPNRGGLNICQIDLFDYPKSTLLRAKINTVTKAVLSSQVVHFPARPRT